MPGPLIVAVLCSLLVAGCAGPDVDDSTPQQAVPAWIQSLQPEPGQESSSVRRVEVTFRAPDAGESVRLEIDGTDVTTYAEFGRDENVGGPQRLVYDAADAKDFVALDPGEHTATVKKVRLSELGEQHEVIDTFTWSFVIQ